MKEKFFKTGRILFGLVLTLVAILTGATSGVMMAAATDLPDAGKINAGAAATGGTGGIATETQGREDGDPEFYSKEIDKRIIKIRPMSTPIDQISRHATSLKTDSFEVKYYSVGTRPIVCKTSAAVTKQTGVASVSLPVDDVNMFTLDDTIRVVGVKALYEENGSKYDGEGDNIPDLVLHVCGVHETSNLPVVYAVNGDWDSKTKQATIVPNIPAGTTLVRMGKACGELDVQTGRFNNLPTAEIQYCQNFMIQIEQSTFDKLAAKEVDWNFSDLEEDAIFDMRIAMENTFLFGDKRVIKHKSKDNMATWFTGGIWWMAGKDIEVGTWNDASKQAVISDNDLVDIAKEMFVGTGVNKRKVMFCGSDMLAAFSKIESEKFRLKDSVEIWKLKFKSWDTDFGEILAVHHELFDLNGMSDCGFAMDPEYLTKRTHVSWARHMLDLKKAGVRNTDAVVLQEVSCLYLRYAKAHARMKLAQAPTEGA